MYRMLFSTGCAYRCHQPWLVFFWQSMIIFQTPVPVVIFLGFSQIYFSPRSQPNTYSPRLNKYIQSPTGKPRALFYTYYMHCCSWVCCFGGVITRPQQFLRVVGSKQNKHVILIVCFLCFELFITRYLQVRDKQ